MKRKKSYHHCKSFVSHFSDSETLSIFFWLSTFYHQTISLLYKPASTKQSQCKESDGMSITTLWRAYIGGVSWLGVVFVSSSLNWIVQIVKKHHRVCNIFCDYFIIENVGSQVPHKLWLHDWMTVIHSFCLLLFPPAYWDSEGFDTPAQRSLATDCNSSQITTLQSTAPLLYH